VTSPTGPPGDAARSPAQSPVTSAAAEVAEVSAGARPERVVAEPPPEPDYPRHRVEPGTRVRLAEVDPAHSEQYGKKKHVAPQLKVQRKRIRELQARLYREHRRSLLIVLQAMDTGGKDGTIKQVFQGSASRNVDWKAGCATRTSGGSSPSTTCVNGAPGRPTKPRTRRRSTKPPPRPRPGMSCRRTTSRTGTWSSPEPSPTPWRR
jgi:hypothetical protein